MKLLLALVCLVVGCLARVDDTVKHCTVLPNNNEPDVLTWRRLMRDHPEHFTDVTFFSTIQAALDSCGVPGLGSSVVLRHTIPLYLQIWPGRYVENLTLPVDVNNITVVGIDRSDVRAQETVISEEPLDNEYSPSVIVEGFHHRIAAPLDYLSIYGVQFVRPTGTTLLSPLSSRPKQLILDHVSYGYIVL